MCMDFWGSGAEDELVSLFKRESLADTFPKAMPEEASAGRLYLATLADLSVCPFDPLVCRASAVRAWESIILAEFVPLAVGCAVELSVCVAIRFPDAKDPVPIAAAGMSIPDPPC